MPDCGKKSRISLRQKIFFLAFGLFLSLILLEVSLRLGGLAVNSARDIRNRLALGREGTCRILCLGESTTLYYPEFLEKALNSKSVGKRFSVINKGAPGINTAAILSQLEHNIKQYRPDMIVAMLGINDEYPRGIRGAERYTREDLLFRDLRVYKLARLIWLHAMSRIHAGHSAGDEEAVEPRELYDKAAEGGLDNVRVYLERGNSLLRQGKFSQAEIILKRVIALDPASDSAYNALGYAYMSQARSLDAEKAFRLAIEKNTGNIKAYCNLGKLYQGQRDLAKAEDAFIRGIKADPGSCEAAIGLGSVYRQEGRFSQAEDVLKKSLALNPGNVKLYRMLAEVYRDLNDQGSAEKCGQIIENKEALDTDTAGRYRDIRNIAGRHGILLVCAQYPMRSTGPLKRIFAGNDQGLIFVDNEGIFKAAVKDKGYKYYFKDSFAGDFGHCTEEGNRLLADNIAGAILSRLRGNK